jgi:integrase/recombinase XerD
MLHVARLLKRRRFGRVEDSDIDRWAKQSAKGPRQRAQKKSLKASAYNFARVAGAWCVFMGWLKKPEAKHFSIPLIKTWAKFLRCEAGLADSTIGYYCWWANEFLQWLECQGVSLRQVTTGDVDAFINHLATRGLVRISLFDATATLRRFLRGAYQKGWCQRDLAPLIVAPRLYRYENIPAGPSWPDVKRMLTATQANSNQDLRNRALLLLQAVYGLRSGEATSLRMEDVDWVRHVLRVRRAKTGRVQD